MHAHGCRASVWYGGQLHEGVVWVYDGDLQLHKGFVQVCEGVVHLFVMAGSCMKVTCKFPKAI